MDGLDGLLLGRGVGRPPEMRPTPHLERRLARFESLPRSIELGGPACEAGDPPRNKGVYCGPLNAESPPVGGLSAIRRSGGFRGKGTFR